MKKTAAIFLLVLAPLLFLPACQTLPLQGSLPDGLTAEKIRSVDTSSPFDLSPDGSVLALVSSGLKLFHIPSKQDILLSGKAPLTLAWSPLGYSLAAIFPQNGGSSIVVYDQQGIAFAEATVDAGLTDLCWLSESELVAGGVRVSTYKFGSNYSSSYFRWLVGRKPPVETTLRDNTLRPGTVNRLTQQLARGPMLACSPQAGAIVYLQPFDPPVFTPYYKLIMKDLASGAELDLASVGFQSAGGRFSADGEKILYGDGSGVTLLYDPWSSEALLKAETAGRNLALSPGGERWIADGMLYRKDGEAVPLAADAAAVFGRDGGRAVIRSGADLYLLIGMKPEEGTMFTPEVADKVAKLRSMRLQGLITPQDYKETLGRIVSQ